MKIFVPSFLVLLCVTSFCFSEKKISFDDESIKKYLEQQIAAENQQMIDEENAHFKSRYKIEPTDENLIKSLEVDDPNEEQVYEIYNALVLINMRNIVSDRIVERAEYIYHFMEDSSTKCEAAEYLLKHKDKGTGIKYLLELLESESKHKYLGRTSRLVGLLLDNGKLEGYSQMGKIIQLDHNSWVLFQKFFPHNGKTYNAQGDKIDLKALLASIKDKTDPELFQMLQNILEGKDPWAKPGNKKAHE